MPNLDEIWAFSEKPELLFELLAGARSLSTTSGRVTALTVGPRSLAEQALAHGADQVLWLGEPQPGTLVEDYTTTLGHLAEQRKPGLILIGATRRGRVVAGRLAAHLGITAITDIQQVQAQGGEVTARHMLYGGGAFRAEKPLSETALLTAGPGVFTAQTAARPGAGEIEEVAWVEPPWRVTLRERKARPAVSVNLPRAKKVVCAGRGLARKEDLQLVEDLAQALGAEVACSRPLAEGLGWLPRERYIGISGATVKPNLYLGVGVSGQPQHAIGMSHSKIVVAINKDQNAPIFAQADYGIVGDLYQVVPELIREVKAHQGK